MNSELIVLLPGILAWWVAASRSLEAALLDVYLPVLMLIPDYFRLPIEGLPDPSFSQCAILPIGVALLWKAVFRREWKISPLDFAVFAFVSWQFISDLYNLGYKEAQNMFFDVLTLAVMPYMAGKALIEPARLRVPVARRFVWLLFVVSVLSIYEFRMGVSLFRPVIARFFPDQDPGWFTQIRWGFGRIAGPYGHAIAMGGILGIGYLLCRWLNRWCHWERQFSRLGALPFTKGQIITAGIVAGMVMTLSRGPWLGALAGMILVSVGASSNRRRALTIALAVLVIGGLTVYTVGKEYINSGPGPMDSPEEQASAQYRAILFDQYVGIALERPIWGWGRGNWPQVPGMRSIDNEYLYVALGSGALGTGLFVLVLCVALWRLFRAGFFPENLDLSERAFRFTLLGVVASTTITIVTVYLGSQLYPLLFFMLGWSEGALVFHKAETEVTATEPAATGFSFVRVIA